MKITAVLSMLHEPARRPNSATRRFRGEAPLAWTLYRLGRCGRIEKSVVLCWEDQAEAVASIAAELGVECVARSARISLPHLDAVAAARRWADGWRGGPLGACEFDRGFHGPWVAEIAEKVGSDAVLLVDPSAALVDPALIVNLIDHAVSRPEIDLCFSEAAPGLSGVLLRKPLIEQLAAGGGASGITAGVSARSAHARSDLHAVLRSGRQSFGADTAPVHPRFRPSTRPHRQRNRASQRRVDLHRGGAIGSLSRRFAAGIGLAARNGARIEYAPRQPADLFAIHASQNRPA